MYKCSCTLAYECDGQIDRENYHSKQLKPGLTARVNGPSWRVTGFHYPSTRAVLTGAWFPLAELTGRVNGPCSRVMETGHPSSRAVNSGRQLG